MQFHLYYSNEMDMLVEIIKTTGNIFIRDTEEVNVFSKQDLSKLDFIGDIYSNESVKLTGTWKLHKVLSDNSTVYCEQGYIQAPLQEGIACKINTFSAFYRTNIITGITKNTKDVIEFYTLSGSFYRLTKGE